MLVLILLMMVLLLGACSFSRGECVHIIVVLLLLMMQYQAVHKHAEHMHVPA